MTFVYRLLFTTVVYSSGPVTEWISKRPSSPVKKPRDIQNRAVPTRMWMPSSRRKSTSPVA